MNPFEYVNSINGKIENLIVEDENNEKFYDPFLTNRAFSYFPDSILYANEMNSRHFLDKRMQYDYLYYGISKKKRFSKWATRNTNGNIDFLVRLYECSKTKAEEIAEVLGETSVELLKQKYLEYTQ
jgi:hypothetical protein